MVSPAARLDHAINCRLACLNFWEFCLYYDNDFFSRRPFLEKVADAFQYVFDEYSAGRSRRVAISLPPRSGKSYITSLFCAWWIGKMPQLCVMRNSCTATLYQKLSRHVRNFIRNEKFAAVFPGVVLSKDNQALDSWSVDGSKQGSYFGGGVDSNIIGSGANLSINDDLYRGIADALNEGYNEKVIEWKESAADSRKEKGCPELFIGTRWRKGDIIGRAIDGDKVDMNIAQPALINNPDEAERKEKPFLSFCEDVRTTAEYLETKRDIDEAIWEAEYMQEPIELKGLAFPLSELKFYNPATVDVNKLSAYRLGVIDPANQGGDDLSAPAGYLIQDKIYIHDIIYNNDGTDINEQPCVDWIKNNGLNGVRFEGNSAWYLFGRQIRRHLEAAGSNCEFRIITNSENKHTRILAQMAFIRNHFIFRSDWESIPQYRKFMKNLTAYLKDGGAKHDDAPDSAAELAKYFQQQHRNLW